ncbi:MAG: hypothetical protein E7031_03530 [Akkermansiaceae bacterium]|nr:hypothetical protein [Akkermansiaceae bacterium]
MSRYFKAAEHIKLANTLCYAILGGMKAQHLLAMALLVAPTTQAAQEVQITDETANTLETAALQQILSDYVRCAVSICELMESIHDKAGAEAAVPRLSARLALIEELQFGVDYMNPAEVDKALSAAGVTPERVDANQTKLQQNKFYGCPELAEVFGLPASYMMESGEVTPELLQALGAELVAALGDQVAGIGGGPGFTEQTAWKMGNNPDNLELIPTIMSALPGAEKDDQTLVYTEEGPIYGRMTFTLPYQGKAYQLQMWFDVTEIIKADEAAQEQETAEEEPEVEEVEPVVIKEDTAAAPETADTTDEEPEPIELSQPEPATILIYSAEERAEAIKTYVQQLNRLLAILQNIHDKDSADAAAEPTAECLLQIGEIQEVMLQASRMDVLEELEKNGNPYQELGKHMNRIIEADFYGSEKLKNAYPL